MDCGKTLYKFALDGGRERAIGEHDGEWDPDIKPDEAWEVWALQFVNTKYNESYGLVIRPVDEERKRWQRVGFYSIYWLGGNGGTWDRPLDWDDKGVFDTITLL